MNPTQDNDADDQLQQVHNPLAVMQPGERVICEIRRHPIGLIGVYTISALVIAMLITTAIMMPYIAAEFLTQQQRLGIVLAAGLAIVVTLLFTYIYSFIYKANRWIVTSDSITEVQQLGLFNRESSQVSLANMEDAIVKQDGVFQTLFNYGNLIVESAGEHSDFTFLYCPDPHEYAKKIIAAHEEYIALNPEEMRIFNRPLANVKGYNQPAGTSQQPPQPPAA